MMAQSKMVLPMTGAEENRHYLRVFIQTYRDLPVLWDTSLRDYTNRDKRAEAYEQLVPIYRYLKRDATVEDVKKKINTLRTNYRKELKVVESARRAGSIHQPRCWTFHELDFLRNTEKFLAVNPNARGEHFVFNENSQTQASFMDTNSSYNFKTILSQASPLHSPPPPPSITEMFQKSFGSHTSQKFEPHQTPALPPPLSLPPHPPSTQQQQHSQTTVSVYGTPTLPPEHQQNIMHTSAAAVIKRQRLSPTSSNEATTTPQNPSCPNGHNSEELLNMAREYLSASYPEEETIARTWAIKLKRLQREQRLLAEKFINDVLFEAESGTLHRGSVQINAFEPYVRYEEQSNEDPSEQHTKSQSPSVHTSSSTTTTTTGLDATDQPKASNISAGTTTSASASTTTTPPIQVATPQATGDNSYSSYS